MDEKGVPDRFVLWCLDTEGMKLAPPALLLTAAPKELVKLWRRRNRWADRVPMLRAVKGDEAGAPGAVRIVDGNGGLDLCAWLPEGGNDADGQDRRASAAALLAQADVGGGGFAAVEMAGGNALELFVGSAGDIARHEPRPIWEIMGEHTDGALACAVAWNHPSRRALVQALATPGPLFAAVSRRFGVSARVLLDLEQLRDALDAREL